ALRTGVKLWLSPAVHQARWRDYWPSNVPGSPGKNWAKLVLPITFILFLLAAIMLVLDNWLRHDRQFALWFAAAITFVPAVVIGFRRQLFGWALAKNPGECWDNDLASGGREPPVERIIEERNSSQQGAHAPRSPEDAGP